APADDPGDDLGADQDRERHHGQIDRQTRIVHDDRVSGAHRGRDIDCLLRWRSGVAHFSPPVLKEIPSDLPNRLTPIPEAGATLRWLSAWVCELREKSAAMLSCCVRRHRGNAANRAPFMTGRTLSRLHIAAVLIAFALLGCGDDEATHRKAFIEFLQSRIVAKPGIHVPKLTTEETTAFGDYAKHYAVIADFN